MDIDGSSWALESAPVNGDNVFFPIAANVEIEPGTSGVTRIDVQVEELATGRVVVRLEGRAAAANLAAMKLVPAPQLSRATSYSLPSLGIIPPLAHRVADQYGSWTPSDVWDGGASFQSVLPGVYWLNVTAPDCGFRHPNPVSVQGGKDTIIILDSLESVCYIAQVTDGAGAPLDDAEAVLFSAGHETQGKDGTIDGMVVVMGHDADEAAHIAPCLMPGDYQLQISTADGLRHDFSVSLAPWETCRRDVFSVMSGTAKVAVKVLRKGAPPTEELFVNANPLGGQRRGSGKRASHGVAEFELSSGPWELMVHSSGGRYYSRRVVIDSTAPREVVFDIGELKQVDLVFDDGPLEPFHGSLIPLSAPSPVGGMELFSAQNRRATSMLEQGSYLVLMLGRIPIGEIFVGPEDHQSFHLHCRVVPIFGTVFDESGDPVSGAILSFSRRDIASASAGLGVSPATMAVAAATDPKGQFENPWFVKGDYWMEVSAAGFESLYSAVQVNGEPFHFQLNRGGGALLASVVDGHGRPVASTISARSMGEDVVVPSGSWVAGGSDGTIVVQGLSTGAHRFLVTPLETARFDVAPFLTNEVLIRPGLNRESFVYPQAGAVLIVSAGEQRLPMVGARCVLDKMGSRVLPVPGINPCTDGAGEYLWGGLIPGVYSASLSDPHTGEESEPTSVVVEAGQVAVARISW